MPAPVDIHLGLRYLRPKRTFISIITLLSVIGPILGVALLVIVTAVMSGFDRNIKERTLSMQAHLHVYPAQYTSDGPPLIRSPGRVVRKLHELDLSAAPVVEGPVLIQVRNQIQTKYLRGIVPEQEEAVTGIKDQTRGRFRLDEGEALVGDSLARSLGVQIGDQLLVHSPARLTQQFKWDEQGRVQAKEVKEVYLPAELKIVGIFDMGVHKFDSNILFTRRDQAADIFGLPWGSATSVHASTPAPFRMEKTTRDAQEVLPGFRIVNWQQANRQLFNALRVEKNLQLFLLTFIVVVAAFGIAGTLITVAVQKTGEIGVLKAMGVGAGAVARIFLVQGAVIGAVGTGAGIGLGCLVIHYREKVTGLLNRVMGVEVFPAELYQLETIPALIRTQDIVLIACMAFVICLLAAVIPALYASLLRPATALQQAGK